jgi:hypothetical protein
MDIDTSLLPPVARDLAELLGLDAALALVERWGGTPLWVQQKPWPELVAAIGEVPAQTLCSTYALERIDVPRCVRSMRAVRDRAILAAASQGTSGAQLARDNGLTRRQITNIKRAQREAVPDPNLDIFAS